MVISFPSAAVFWSAYQASKRTFHDVFGGTSSPHAAPVIHASAASVAEICVASIRTPFEVVKQQLQGGLHKSTTAAVRTIISVDGFRGLYAGYGSTIARDIPFDIIQFVLYEHFKKKLADYRGVCRNRSIGPTLAGWIETRT
jgi:solute carrier family 25 (mitochondrial S-adenosylmethionine transporter), member 26